MYLQTKKEIIDLIKDWGGIVSTTNSKDILIFSISDVYIKALREDLRGRGLYVRRIEGCTYAVGEGNILPRTILENRDRRIKAVPNHIRVQLYKDNIIVRVRELCNLEYDMVAMEKKGEHQCFYYALKKKERRHLHPFVLLIVHEQSLNLGYWVNPPNNWSNWPPHDMLSASVGDAWHRLENDSITYTPTVEWKDLKRHEM